MDLCANVQIQLNVVNVEIWLEIFRNLSLPWWGTNSTSERIIRRLARSFLAEY